MHCIRISWEELLFYEVLKKDWKFLSQEWELLLPGHVWESSSERNHFRNHRRTRILVIRMRILLTKPAFSERFFFFKKKWLHLHILNLIRWKKIVPFDKNLNINETKNLKKVILIVFNWRKYEIYNSVDRFLWDMSRNARIGENGRNGN